MSRGISKQQELVLRYAMLRGEQAYDNELLTAIYGLTPDGYHGHPGDWDARRDLARHLAENGLRGFAYPDKAYRSARASLTRMLDSLEQRKLIVRYKYHKKGGRAWRMGFELTDEGRRVAEEKAKRAEGQGNAKR